VAVGSVLALAVVVRFATASPLWLDEAQSVAIARFPLRRIPEVLRHDGAPPLYYALLHAWMRVFGTSALAVRALSGVFAVGALPLAWLAGRRLGGRQVAWGAVVLLGASPFAVRYATEARMYSLVILCVLAGYLALTELLDRPRSRRAFLGVALVTAVLVLTHYWALYLLAVVGATMVWFAWRGSGRVRPGARRALAAMALGSLVFVPWLPAFFYQAAHTGTPWGQGGKLRSVFDTVFYFAGGYWDPTLPLGLLLWGLIALGLFGRAVDGRRLEIDLHTRPPGRYLALTGFGTLVLALVATRVTASAFSVRYAAVLFPLLILLAALGTGVFASRKVFHTVMALAVVLGFWSIAPNVFGDRTSAARVASALRASASPGDVVVYCPDQLGPSVSRLLPQSSGLDQLTFPRATPPDLVDWVDYGTVNRASQHAPFARMVLERAGSRTIWVVWAPGYQTFKTKCERLLDDLTEARPDNARVVKLPRNFEKPGLVRYRPA
jgi:uncharacterized membrane protein